MALEPEDREDMLGQAIGLPERAEFLINSTALPVFVGFRHDAAATWHFGSDRVFQFDPSVRLRRAFIHGVRYAASEGKLCALHQPQSGGQIRLDWEPVDDTILSNFLQMFRKHCQSVQGALEGNNIEWVGSTVQRRPFIHRLIAWIDNLPAEIEIAASAGLPRSTQ